MSAIAGIVFVDGRAVTDTLLATLSDAAMPRGFDGVTRWHDGPAGFIRFHHATTPEAVGERQPLTGDTGATIAFDGRLDNRADLLALLGARGRDLAAAPDVALVLALFEARGERLLKDLVGDWALAIWQPTTRRLFCARSPMGWRPLLWTFDGTRFAFATEPRTLIVGLGLDRSVNEGAIGEMISARFVTQTETLWKAIERLGQGAALVLDRGSVRSWHWHDGPFEDFSRRSDADHVERFNALFDQALIASMRANTAVGAHLSGGLDSSSVVARLTELHRAGTVARQVRAISARFPGEAVDETVYSSAVERHLGITARVTGRDPYPLDAARQWCATSLQLPLRPNVHEGITAGLRLQRAAGERVLLTGEGGDDWMTGTIAHFPDLLRQGRMIRLAREGMSRFPGEAAYVRVRRAFHLALMPLIDAEARRQFILPQLKFDGVLPRWIRPEWAGRIGLADRWRDHAPRFDPPGFTYKQRYANFAHARRHLAHEPILAYAESNGIEMRHPMHDLRLTHFLIGAAGWMLRRDGEKKYILREAMRGTLPELVRTRQDKATFLISQIDATAAYLHERPAHDLLPAQFGWIDPEQIEEMFAPARAWRANGSSGKLDRGKLGPLWFILALDMWLANAVGL